MSKWLMNEIALIPLDSFTGAEQKFFLRQGFWIWDADQDRHTSPYWAYHDYIEHGIFPGIDDYLRLTAVE